MKGVPLNDELYNYIVDIFAKEDEVLTEVVNSTVESKIPQIQISPELGKFLSVQMKSINARNVLEIGTLAGYSSIWMARALPEGGKLTTLEISKEHADAAAENFRRAGLESKIDLMFGPAMDSLEKLDGQKFDFVFIDADKTGYPAYFEKVIGMVRSGGIIAADNTLRDGNIVSKEPDDGTKAVQRFNKLVAFDPRVDSILVPISDGLTLSLVK